MQTITDFIVRLPNGKLTMASHRDNTEHIVTGASSTLFYSGIAKTQTVSAEDVGKWVGEQITVREYWGTPIFVATVLAKSKRLWDMSQPMGNRLHEQQKSKAWDHYFNLYLKIGQ